MGEILNELVADLMCSSNATTQAMTAWAQLRLQGRFTTREAMCPFCQSQCDTTLAHHLLKCQQSMQYLEPLRPMMRGFQVDDLLEGTLLSQQQMELVVHACGNIRKAAAKA